MINIKIQTFEFNLITKLFSFFEVTLIAILNKLFWNINKNYNLLRLLFNFVIFNKKKQRLRDNYLTFQKNIVLDL